MRDPLAVEALLVIYGTTLAALFGVGVLSDGPALSIPAAVAGAVAVALAAALWRLAVGRVGSLTEWFLAPAETSRERARLLVPLALLVIAHFVVLPLLPPVVFHGALGAAVALVALGLGHVGWRLAGSAGAPHPE